jgi:MFS family permease
MTQSFDPAPQPGQTPVSDRALEAQNRQAAIAELTRRVKIGANNFFGIAGLSVINTFLSFIGSDTRFVIGLGITQFVDAVAYFASLDVPEASGILTIVAVLIDLVIVGIFVLFGFFARRGRRWAFMVGMVLYAIDALLLLAFQDWLGLAFHALFLFWLFGGLRALNELNKLQKPQRADFPQNIGAP